MAILKVSTGSIPLVGGGGHPPSKKNDISNWTPSRPFW